MDMHAEFKFYKRLTGDLVLYPFWPAPKETVIHIAFTKDSQQLQSMEYKNVEGGRKREREKGGGGFFWQWTSTRSFRTKKPEIAPAIDEKKVFFLAESERTRRRMKRLRKHSINITAQEDRWGLHLTTNYIETRNRQTNMVILPPDCLFLWG